MVVIFPFQINLIFPSKTQDIIHMPLELLPSKCSVRGSWSAHSPRWVAVDLVNPAEALHPPAPIPGNPCYTLSLRICKYNVSVINHSSCIVCLSVSDISLSMVFSRFVMPVACDRISFLIVAGGYSVTDTLYCVYLLDFGRFLLLTIMNGATVNMCVQVFM